MKTCTRSTPFDLFFIYFFNDISTQKWKRLHKFATTQVTPDIPAWLHSVSKRCQKCWALKVFKGHHKCPVWLYRNVHDSQLSEVVFGLSFAKLWCVVGLNELQRQNSFPVCKKEVKPSLWKMKRHFCFFRLAYRI